LFVDVNAGGVITGALVRPTLGLGVGWGFPLGDLTLAPSLRYQQVIQGTDPIESRDARLLLLGVELMLGEVAPAPPPPPPPTDRDGDGFMDDVDRCPDNAEDFDGFEDADGCPDPDNDQDAVLDVNDGCINEPEDKDGFEDADGCPDPDNDRDAFLDADDECPNDAEVINGISDYDGCPDVGLITMIDDRIILEERVLFDFERARIKSKAKPVLQAIVTLQQQHPEWISVRVEGHADARGDAAFNQDLSNRRAANVRESLVELGISSGLIDSVGYGATRLRDMRETEEGHQYNRRVEFVVVARRHETTGVVAPAAAAPTSSATPAATPAEPAAAPAEPAAVTEDEATP
jgi:outer membrane protein OmpA-like peptidoglycan-associated protein